MEKSDYNFADRLLHRLALGVPAIARASFELDRFTAEKESAASEEKHVFVSGLARAGTTILMRTFYETGNFCSLTYRNMPFVLMPCTWKKLSSSFQKKHQQKERAHGDGILVSFDSPEAFEEVFWRVYCARDYIFDTNLRPHTVSNETIGRFREYVQRITSCACDQNQRRYLSKNNNNILRLGVIRKAFPESIIIIPFRDPFQHAVSLFNQHLKFCERHAEDSFSRAYMYWLGHHEFGLTHKAFRFPGNDETLPVNYTPDNINYWLKVWLDTYSYILGSAPDGCLFVCFESLCNSPADTLGHLFEATGLKTGEYNLHNKIRPTHTRSAKGVNTGLGNQAQQVYKELQSLALNIPVRPARHEQ